VGPFPGPLHRQGKGTRKYVKSPARFLEEEERYPDEEGPHSFDLNEEEKGRKAMAGEIYTFRKSEKQGSMPGRGFNSPQK